MKKAGLLGLMLAAGLALVACGNDGGDKQGNSTDDSSSGKTELTLWMDRDEYAEALEIAIEEEFPTIDIVYENVASGEAADKLALDGPAGIGGDIVFHTQESMAKAFQADVLLPLGEELSTFVVDNMIEPSLNAVTSEGTVFGVPMSVESLILFYNKTLIEENGFELATTFEDILEQAETYNNVSEGKYLFRLNPGNTYTAYMFLTATGFELFGPEGNDPSLVNLNTPEVVEGLTYLQKLQTHLQVPSADLNFDTVVGEFAKGNVGYMIEGPWQFNEITNGSEEHGFEWGVMPVPTINGKQPQPFLGNISATISAYTEYPEEAREVLKFITSNEGLQIMYDIEEKLPALKDLSGIEGVSEDANLMALSEQCSLAASMPMLKELNYVYEAADIMVQSVWDGLSTPEDAAEKAYNDFNQLIQVSQ